jgi:two-component system CheB/CheR fusion protein
MTFVPLTDIKQMQEELLAARELAEGIVDTVREPLIVVDAALRVVSASRSFYQRFHVVPEETVGRLLYELGNRQWDIPALRELLETVLPRHRSFDAFAVEHEFPVIGRCRMLVSARRIVGATGETQLILLAIEMTSPGE